MRTEHGLQRHHDLVVVRGAGAVTFESRIVNAGDRGRRPVLGDLGDMGWRLGRIADRVVADVVGGNDWLAENRWFSAGARELLPDLTRPVHEHDPRGAFSTAIGAWSTDGSLPLGVLVDEMSGSALGWQIEHNGAWRWEVGERPDGVYVSLLGPTDAEHHWYAPARTGEEFTTVPASWSLSTGRRTKVSSRR